MADLPVPSIDPFSSMSPNAVATYFLKERDRRQRQADLAWLRTLTLFSDYELRLLNDLGYLSRRDRELLSRAGRAL